MRIFIWLVIFIWGSFFLSADPGKLSLQDLEVFRSEDASEAVTKTLATMGNEERDKMARAIIKAGKCKLLPILYLNHQEKGLEVISSIDVSTITSEVKLDFLDYFVMCLQNDGLHEIAQKTTQKFISACLVDNDPNIMSSALEVANKFSIKGLEDKLTPIAMNAKFGLETRINALIYLLKNDSKVAIEVKAIIDKEIENLNDIEQQMEYALKISDNNLRNKILLKGLNSDDPNERLASFLFLNKITGKSFDYNPIGSKKEIEQSILLWKAYLQK
jgi:hypothetical protein